MAALLFLSVMLCWKILYPEQSPMMEFISNAVLAVFLLGFSEMAFCALANSSVWFISKAFH